MPPRETRSPYAPPCDPFAHEARGAPSVAGLRDIGKWRSCQQSSVIPQMRASASSAPSRCKPGQLVERLLQTDLPFMQCEDVVPGSFHIGAGGIGLGKTVASMRNRSRNEIHHLCDPRFAQLGAKEALSSQFSRAWAPKIASRTAPQGGRGRSAAIASACSSISQGWFIMCFHEQGLARRGELRTWLELGAGGNRSA